MACQQRKHPYDLPALGVLEEIRGSTCRDVVCYDGDLQEGKAEVGISPCAGVPPVISVKQRLVTDMKDWIKNVASDLEEFAISTVCILHSGCLFGTLPWGHFLKENPKKSRYCR